MSKKNFASSKNRNQCFVEMWNEAIENDPYWQFEELLEEEPELAEAIWDEMSIEIMVKNRLRLQGIYL